MYSSFEEESSCSECSEDADSDEIPTYPVFVMSGPIFGRRRSVAANLNLLESQNSDAYYEDILKKNIRLWKHSKSISNGSLNSVVSGQELVEEED